MSPKEVSVLDMMEARDRRAELRRRLKAAGFPVLHEELLDEFTGCEAFLAVEAGLPVLEQGLAEGLSLNDAGCAALLHILSAEADTNMIARSSLETAEEIRGAIRELLQETPFPDRETLEALDLRFRELNLSPGGSADLLAICYLLHFMKTETLV